MALDERKMQVIELMLKGETISDIARIAGVSRQAIYDWQKQEDFKCELDKCRQELKRTAEAKIAVNSNKYVSELERIAMTSNSERTRLEALQYLLNRHLGTPTSKIQNIDDEDAEETVPVETLDGEFDEFSKLLDNKKRQAQ